MSKKKQERSDKDKGKTRVSLAEATKGGYEGGRGEG